MKFWGGSGSADLYFLLMDPDPDPTPDPTPFFGDFSFFSVNLPAGT